MRLLQSAPRALTDATQLPLGLLTAATGHPMLVELKSGETLNGLLVNCDTWMNLTLREVVQTSADGDKFMRLPEIYVRGSTVSVVDCMVQDKD
jgi:U6 snRNA-associated Sm-like protein LSm4